MDAPGLGNQLRLYRVTAAVVIALIDRPVDAEPRRSHGYCGGGGTPIDPPREAPPAEDILEEIETPIVIN